MYTKKNIRGQNNGVHLTYYSEEIPIKAALVPEGGCTKRYVYLCVLRGTFKK